MKKLTFWIFLICLPAGAQILSPIFFQNSSNVISYCSVPGYPAAPYATGLQFKYSADCITFTSSVCGTLADGSNVNTWADSSGNGRDATYNQGNHSVLHTNVLNSLPAVTSFAGWYVIGGSAITSNNLHTIFAVIKNASDNQALLAGGVSALGYGFGISASGSGRQTIWNISTGNFIGSGTTSLNGSWHSIMGQETGGLSGPGLTRLFHVDRTVDTLIIGTNTSFTNNTPPTSLFYDPTDSCCGYGGLTAEVLYYNTQLTADQIVYNECYLYKKWNQ